MEQHIVAAFVCLWATSPHKTTKTAMKWWELQLLGSTGSTFCTLSEQAVVWA